MNTCRRAVRFDTVTGNKNISLKVFEKHSKPKYFASPGSSWCTSYYRDLLAFEN